jgi:hypothetical protein
MDLLASKFPALEQLELNYISPEKRVRYIPLISDSNTNDDICPVKEFIFIKYDSSVDFLLETIEPLQAFKLLLGEAWFSAKRNNVKILFDQLFKASFYKITYSDNRKAMDAVTKIFGHDQ